MAGASLCVFAVISKRHSADFKVLQSCRHFIWLYMQVISKSARKAPEAVVSSMGQNMEEDPDTVSEHLAIVLASVLVDWDRYSFCFSCSVLKSWQ